MADIDGEKPSEVLKGPDLDAIAQENGFGGINWSRTPVDVRRLVGVLASKVTALTAEAAGLVNSLGLERERADNAERRASVAEQTAQRVFIDAKTKIPNLSAFVRDMNVLVRNIGRSERRRQGDVPGAHDTLLFLDLDNFKPVNEECGYDFGDFVLKMVTRRWREEQRAGDETYRWGGDEFTKIARNVMPKQDGATAQNMVDSVEEVKGIILTMIDDEEAFRALILMCNDETQALPENLARLRMRNVIQELGVTVGYTIIDEAMAGISQDEIVRRTHSRMQRLKHDKKQPPTS